MARRPPASGTTLPQQTRQNEYFVPRDGIDREVITADICRYLGNDALVRPGNYENPENGQIIQGYFINAYRNLTSAMIQDLKADSARWDQERRQQSANRSNAGGGVQYRNSDIHQLRQHYGPTDSSYPGTAGGDPFDNAPRYPGTGTSGYTGAASSYPQQYAAAQGGYTQSGYTANTSQFAPSPGNVPPYGSGHSVTTAGFGQTSSNPPYNIVDHNLRAGTQTQADPYGNDPYGASRDPRGDPRDQRVPVTTTMAPARATYTTTGPPSTQAFAPQGQSSNYYPQGTTSASAPYPPAVQPGDPFYGRASPAGTASYSAASDQHGPSRRERESVERHTDQRHGHRNRR
ncbi:putative transcription factor [Rosellinia necatrix]|uniref:Putative transcription factor n=1 Tax=Rosellinia necatrix TaxID=77044 RepID=A0A1W2TNL2_ROSNE|nr:putative transcription factor [Rosellinia necatrix]